MRWKSADPTIASLSADIGDTVEVTGNNEGKISIAVWDEMTEVYWKIGGNYESTYIIVGYTLEITPPQVIKHIGQVEYLQAQFRDKYGNVVEFSPSAEYNWSSATGSVARIIDPIPPNNVLQVEVKAIGCGSERITARENLSGFQATAQIIVPANVTVTPNYSSLCVNDTITLAATLKDTQGHACPNPNVFWSSNSSAVQLTPQGTQAVLVKGKSVGRADIKAECGGQFCNHASASIEVVDANSTITISTPYHNGMKVFTSVAGLMGTIVTDCGQGRVTGLVVTVEDTKGESQIYPPAPVGTDGSFAIAVGLDWGVNKLKFETYVGSNKISNNMEDVDFTLERVPHCLKDGGTLSLPATTATGIPLLWISEDPRVASVDSTGHILTANADGWAWVYADVGTIRVVRLVGVSSMSDWVPGLSRRPLL